MPYNKKEKSLVYPILAFTVFTVVSLLLSALPSASVFFVILAGFSTMAVVFIGVYTEVKIRLKKWAWATKTERFNDGSSMTSMKLSILGAWWISVVVCVLCFFTVILALY